MGLLLFLLIVGGFGLLYRYADANARPNPFLLVHEIEPTQTALDNVYEHLEAPKPKRSHHKKKPIPDPPFRAF